MKRKLPKVARKGQVKAVELRKALVRVSTIRVLCGNTGQHYVRCGCCDEPVPVATYPKTLKTAPHAKDCLLHP